MFRIKTLSKKIAILEDELRLRLKYLFLKVSGKYSPIELKLGVRSYFNVGRSPAKNRSLFDTRTVKYIAAL